MTENSNYDNLDQFLSTLSPQLKNVIAKIIKAERAKSHLKSPLGIKNEIRQIIKQESDSK